MQQLILVIHVLAAVAIIALVLMQHGRGADVGASFGSGSSNTMFGSSGSMPFLMKVTAACAAVFFVTSLSLNYLASRSAKKSEVFTIPAAPKTVKKLPAKENAGVTFAPSSDMSQDKVRQEKGSKQ